MGVRQWYTVISAVWAGEAAGQAALGVYRAGRGGRVRAGDVSIWDPQVYDDRSPSPFSQLQTLHQAGNRISVSTLAWRPIIARILFVPFAKASGESIGKPHRLWDCILDCISELAIGRPGWLRRGRGKKGAVGISGGRVSAWNNSPSLMLRPASGCSWWRLFWRPLRHTWDWLGPTYCPIPTYNPITNVYLWA